MTSLALMGAALAAVGCSSLAPEDDTYETKVLGVNPDKQTAADWTCLGQPPQPPPTLAPDAMVTYTFPLVEWVTNAPIPGRKITVCNRIDPDCTTALPATVMVDDTSPNVSVTLRAGQSVFLLLEAPGVFPTRLYFDGPLYSTQDGGKIQMLTPMTVGSLAQQVQIALDPSLGVLAIRPHDCRGTIVSGALYTIDSTGGTATPYAFSNGLPRAASPAVPAASTTIPSDNTPWAGFVNVPLGGLTVYGVLADGTNREIGSTDVAVKPLAITVVEVRALNHL
jgi:hypothetical protein